MKHKFSLILFSALLSTTFAWAQTTSAYYEVPAGAFFAGMTDNSGQAAGEFYVPYLHYSAARDTFRSAAKGYWQSSTKTENTQYTYTYANKIAKNRIPQLDVSGKKKYQYGSSSEEFNNNLYFYIGDSVMRYMTPARLWADLVTQSTGYRIGYGDNYSTAKSDTMGVYFNNIDTMYIDGISIPIAYSSSVTTKTEDDLFPNEYSHVKVTIYPATITTGGTTNVADRDSTIWTDILTIDDFTPLSETEHYRGALNATFDKPISVEGPFVIELSEMKTSGCSFTVLSDRSSGKNKWGYYIQKGNVGYPGNFCLAVSVHAMFPALYPKAGEGESLNVTIPVGGAEKDEQAGTDNRPSRTVYANHKYNALNKDGWSREHTISGITLNYGTRTNESTKWYFTMSPNRTGAIREGDVIFNFRGKELTYHVIQAAPTLTPREGMEKEKTFEIPLLDDTVHINDVKVTEVYLESEVSLYDTINVTSEKELTKIVKWFGNENGKYYVKFIFTRKKYVLTDTEDIITVSFLGNPNNKYEYTILHEGTGTENLNLRPNVASRTFVTGPKPESKVWVLDEEKDSLTNLKSIRVYSDVPAAKLKLGWYKEEHLGYVNIENLSDDDGEYKLITPHVNTENTTGADLLDSFYVCLPYWDTVKFYLRQEAKPRVAYYEVPEGTFFAGMTDNSGQAPGEFYLPYLHYETDKWHIFTSQYAGIWTSSTSTEQTKKTYSYRNEVAKNRIPMLEVDGLVRYQYGATDSTKYNENLYFYVGDSLMRYMTPARLWTDLETDPAGYKEDYLENYMTSSSKIGVYFNNIDTMYIDGISIPISAGSTDAAKSKTKTDLFGTNGNVKVTIYHALITDETKQKVDVENPIWSGTLTNGDISFTPLSETASYRGALNAKFNDSISIDGPFVVELSDMSGCDFYVLSDKSNGKNKWGYYIQDESELYPQDNTPAISVHGMFPVLYPKEDESLTIEIPAEGASENARPSRIVYANYKWTKDANGWNRTDVEGVQMNFFNKELGNDSTKWYFAMKPNYTGKAIEGDITFTFRGKSLTYHIFQAALPGYTRSVDSDSWGTICLPCASTALEGATFYNVIGSVHSEYGIALEEITALEAGKPYVFKATANQITVTYDLDGTIEESPVYADNHIIGSFTGCPVPVDNYIIYNNLLYITDGTATIGANRAYFDVDAMESYNPATAPARVVFFGGRQAPTGLEVQDARCTMHDGKYLINGQFVIIKDNKMYNAQGIEL